MSARTRIILLTTVLVVSSWTLTGCGGSDGDSSSNDSSTKSTGQSTKPDLTGVPDVVAVVDGTKISKDEFVTAYTSQFQQAATQAKSSGQPLDQDQLKKQTAESLVNTQLLVDEADDRGYTASQDDIDKTLADLAKQNGLSSPKELLDALAKQGVDKAEARKQLEGQVKLDRLMAEEAGNTDPTDKELHELYDATVAQQGGAGGQSADLPPFDEVRPQLEEQVRKQKENSAAEALVGKLRKGADITINL